ncbi:hypothetical protein QBC33DRAFT_547672 [Phialemonium atrogriseum]|uniref:Secreted protein n=1 Tax=Phialemonium atrogriseum TaxID=1093897 RepID=A0AAJ0BU61_9PEZI|nr:uncharacterized protein QBC33DRAFT_547672 [Phialemonium atrogriseum]KAK1764281.1 hypothetical protein QBC33DRAFT_547672 [Phialemonium atrogriseum]
MKFLSALLLPALALAAPTSLDPRQAGQIQITSVTASGAGCPQGSFSTSISPDGTVITFGFDSYQTLVGPQTNQREEDCNIFLGLRFPVGCSSASISTTYHGFAQIDSGVTGTLQASYNLSPGSLTGSTPTTTFTSASWGGGGVYTKQDTLTAKATINSPNQQNVNFEIRNRAILQASNSAVSGTLTVDDTTITITQIKKC